MSTITGTATTTLYVNGRPAQDELARLRTELDRYKQQLLDIAKDPSKGLGSQAWNSTLKKVQATEKELGKVQSNVANVTQALARLDKATPEELRKALRQLNKELASIERGSQAWNEQVKKIRAVKEELAKVNSELKAQPSLWDRFAKKMFDWGAALQVTFGAITGLTMTARKAVEAYASMDQEMAGVRKFTGMTAEQIEELNEEFKKMDTRTSREELNKLAQDAGRLGKSTQEDVLGFVRAADQINVALDDLGEGATLTLSKIAGAFGDEDKYGTEQALLKTGSVINELSQNCRASAPYLADFTQRLTGAGTTAKMTTPQLMAFGAVLDSNGAQLESSATALGQLIIKLYRDPAKYAETAGMDVKKFTNLLKTDANEAVLMFLETLHNAGNLEVLAPMLADMGEKGSRSVQTLTMLAGKIDEVRAQQAVANQAFEEGISVTQEFNVQNNTVQAGLDKAKNKFNEIAVQLGKQLLPVMRFAITSTSAMMKALALTIDFIIKYKSGIITVISAIAAYEIAVNLAVIKTKLFAAWTATVTAAQAAWLATQRLLAAGLALLHGNVTRATAALKLFSRSLHASPIGLAAAAVTALVVAIGFLIFKTKELTAAQEALNKVNDRAMQKASDELTILKKLYETTQDTTKSIDDRRAAVAKLQEMYPEYFKNLSTEAVLAGNAANEYARLTNNIIAKARAEARKEILQENEKEILKLQQERDNKVNTAIDEVDVPSNNSWNMVGGRLGKEQYIMSAPEEYIRRNYILQVKETYDRKIGRLRAQDDALADDVVKDIIEEKTPSGGGGGYTPPSDDNKNGGGRKSTEDKFKAEKQWRAEQDALNKIAYLKGEKDYEAYVKRMDEIAVEFYDKQLARTDLTQTERLTIQSQYYEATRKQQETANSLTAEDEDRAYAERLAELRQSFIDGTLTRDEYNRQTELEELEHLRRMDQIQAAAAQGNNDPAVLQRARQAHEAYQQKLLTNQDKMRKAAEEREKEHLKRLGDAWQQYFVTDEEKKQEQYKLGLQMLDRVYANEVKAAAGNAAAKLEIDKRYAKARKKLHDEIFNNEKTGQKSWEQWIGAAMDKIFGEGTWDKYGEVVKQAFASMTSMMQSFNQLAQAEAEIKLARLEKQYDREISMAEGNNRKVKALERKKEKETARVKADAQRKEFAQQVMNAISSTALAAINAYASAAKIAWWLGPVAAGMALAAGAVQVAAIKKQQEASEAKGFAQGGFTPDGPKDKPVGVVHAGEWVASQKLLANPVARPMIEALDYAQRNNTLGSLRPVDVSRSITAPAVLAQSQAPTVIVQQNEELSTLNTKLSTSIDRLNERLNEPFVTVNTVTGDMGIKQAQDEYQRLMNNTLPKYKRS